MKISSSQMFIDFGKRCFAALMLLFVIGAFKTHAQGEALFQAKCATCHQVFKDGTGPKLYEVRRKWSDGGASEESIFQWVNNWSNAAASDSYAKSVSTWSRTSMTKFPELTKEQITTIFDWVDIQEEAIASNGTALSGEANTIDSDSSLNGLWIVLAVIFITVILAVGGVRRQLDSASAEMEGVVFDDNMTYLDELKKWAWGNRKSVIIGVVIIVLGLVVTIFLKLYTVGIVENYQPSQPIDFPHSVHAGTNEIDCKYCHNSVSKSKTAGLPTVNVCMNCHKQISGSTPEQQEEINKIYAAAGYDPAGPGKYTGEIKEIIWNKVHVLPDHVYFNHSQHVEVGGIDCKQCHGDMALMAETAKVHSIEELNEIEGNIQLTKRTLTMGWCIECHKEKEISKGPLDIKDNGYYDEIHKRLINGDKKLYQKYLEDGKVTVMELGGWECAKCHY